MPDELQSGHPDIYAERVARAWGAAADGSVRSFWQSPVVMSEINRRITGDRAKDPVTFFFETFCRAPFTSALSLGCGGGELEMQFLELGVCDLMLGVDLAEERVAAARRRTPPELRHRIRFETHNLEDWQPSERYDLVVARDVLHHIADLERWCLLIADRLADGGLVYVHDFIGPARFQWTDAQIGVVNRLLEQLPDELIRDIVHDDGRPRQLLGRPDLERFIAADPSEAINPRVIPSLLSTHLEPVLTRHYGGALFHPFFNRIMGNFAEHPDLVRLVMEFDFLLTDGGMLEADYLWGVYRKRSQPG